MAKAKYGIRPNTIALGSEHVVVHFSVLELVASSWFIEPCITGPAIEAARPAVLASKVALGITVN